VTMSLPRVWAEHRDVLLAHLTSPEGPAVALVGRSGRVVECNEAFNGLAGSGGGAVGRVLAELEALGPPAEGQREVPEPLYLRLGSGGEQVVSFHAYAVAGGTLLIGDRVLFTETRIVAGLAALHEELVNTTRELYKRNLALEEARERLKTLRGLLPICCSCEKIRNDRGYWEQIEVYVRDRTDADFTHGVCPECVETLYPGYGKKRAAALYCPPRPKRRNPGATTSTPSPG